MTEYIIKSGILLSLFHLFFILFMRRTTFFRFNRVMLLAGSAVCMILPLMDLSAFFSPAAGFIPRIDLHEITISPSMAETGGAVNPQGPEWGRILTSIYLSGAAAVLMWIAVSMLRMFSVIRSGERVNVDGRTITISDRISVSFSFFGTIVMSREDFDRNPAILKHEQMHVRCFHSLDIILFEVLTILYWFNPIVWLTRQELRQLHEFEVDEAVIRSGVNATDYQLLIVKKAVGEERFLLANGFNHTKLKNRITMIQKNRSMKWARLGYVACFPILLAALGLFNAQPAEAQEKNGVVAFTMVQTIDKVDVRPTINIQGKEQEIEMGLAKWVMQNLKYPQKMVDEKVSGTVKVSVLIQSDGTIGSFCRIVEGINEELDNEVLRVIKSAPECKPAMKDGKATPVEFVLPVVFSLK